MSGGRPTKRTPDVKGKILKALRDGNTRTAAAGAGGINQDTFFSWLREFPEFSESVKKAEAEAEAAHVAVVKKAGKDGTWQASAWWLERRRHEAWGRKDLLAAQLGRLTDDELRDLITRGNSGHGPGGANGAGAPTAAIAEHATSDGEP